MSRSASARFVAGATLVGLMVASGANAACWNLIPDCDVTTSTFREVPPGFQRIDGGGFSATDIGRADVRRNYRSCTDYCATALKGVIEVESCVEPDETGTVECRVEWAGCDVRPLHF